tara:strand:- start:8598 stop:8897 length:300 start_codon:yes stop_codon:yes gene_type:complete
MEKKYRILEEKHELGSKFYPQFREGQTIYLMGSDANGKDIYSDYQYCTNVLVNGGIRTMGNIVFDNIKDAEKHIDLQSKHDKRNSAVIDTQIHEYEPTK